MHASDYEVEGVEYTILHDGDYSGDVTIVTPAEDDTLVFANLVHASSIEDAHWEIQLPFELIEKLVLDSLRRKAIDELENLDYDKLREWCTP